MVQVAFSYQERKDLTGTNDAHFQHVQRRVAAFRASNLPDSPGSERMSTDAVKLLAIILHRNARVLTPELRKAMLKRWAYPERDAEFVTPSFFVPMRVCPCLF